MLDGVTNWAEDAEPDKPVPGWVWWILGEAAATLLIARP